MRRAAALLALCIGCGDAALALEGNLVVPSRTISDEVFLRGDDSAAPPVALSGELSGGEGDGPHPVVILLHGTGGPKAGAAGSWRRYLNDNGIATLRLDLYSARGLAEASTDQGSFGQFAGIYDAYRAADALAADPRIDASRIAVMGFSRGGTAALYAAMTRFHEAFGPKHARIVAYLPFYPSCNFALVEELDVVDAPIREFHGADDDWTLAAPCGDYIERLKAAGADAAMTVYPGALHGFDNLGNPSRHTDSAAQSSRRCFRREVDYRLINAATGEPFDYTDACVEYGPSTQYNDAAATAARAAVKDILDAAFAPAQ